MADLLHLSSKLGFVELAVLTGVEVVDAYLYLLQAKPMRGRQY